MSQPAVSFPMTSDASRVLAEQEKVRTRQKGVTNSFGETTREAARFDSMAKRISRSVETLEERHSRLRKEAKQAFDTKRIGFDEYLRRVKQVDNELDEARKKLDDVDDANDEAFGDSAIGKVAQWGSAIAATLGPLALVRTGLQDIQAQVDASQAEATESRRGVGSLRQLADSQAEFDALVDTAKRFRLSGATESLGEASEVVFALQSANLLTEEATQLFLDLGKRQVVPDLGKFARAVRTQLASFGRAETGGAEQIISKAFAASAFSPASVEDLLEAAALPGGVARFQGISDEEVLAATALLATSSGSADVGATALRSFLFSTGEREEFKGVKLKKRVQRLQSQNLNTPELKELLGRKEAIRGFTDLENAIDQFDEVLASIRQANSDRQAVQRKIRFSDPISEAVRLGQISEAEAEIGGIATGALAALNEGVLQREIFRGRQDLGDGVISSISTGLLRALSGTARFTGGEEDVNKFLRGEGFSTQAEDDIARELIELQRESLGLLRELKDETANKGSEQVKEQQETNRKLSDGLQLNGTEE